MEDMTHSSTSCSESEEEAANVPLNGAPPQPVMPPGAAPPQPLAAPPVVIAAILATMRGIVNFNTAQRCSLRQIRNALVAAHPGYDAVIDDMIRQAWTMMSQEEQHAPQQPEQRNQRQSPGAGGATA